MNEVLIVETTCGPRAEAERLGRSLVDVGLSACCHMVPMRSCYRWRGVVEETDEILLRWKVVRSSLDQALAHIRSRHPYEVPELLVTSATSANPAYSQWLEQNSDFSSCLCMHEQQ